MAAHTPGPLTIRRSPMRDNTGGYDYAIVDADGKIIAEVFEHVGKSIAGYDVRPAHANAALFAASPKMCALLRKLAYEPIGHAEASAREILDALTAEARSILAIAKIDGAA